MSIKLGVRACEVRISSDVLIRTGVEEIPDTVTLACVTMLSSLRNATATATIASSSGVRATRCSDVRSVWAGRRNSVIKPSVEMCRASNASNASRSSGAPFSVVSTPPMLATLRNPRWPAMCAHFGRRPPAYCFRCCASTMSWSGVNTPMRKLPSDSV